MRFLKWFALVLILLAAALFVIPLFIPKQTYVDFVIRRLENRYPVELTVTDASLFLLPFPRVTLKQAVINTRTGDTVTPFLEADRLTVETTWSGLLSRTLPLDLILRQGRVTITEISPGLFNTDGLTAKSGPESTGGGWRIQPRYLSIGDTEFVYQTYGQPARTYGITTLDITDTEIDGHTVAAEAEVEARLPQFPHTVALAGPVRYDSEKKQLSTTALQAETGDVEAVVTGSVDFAESPAFLRLKVNSAGSDLENMLALAGPGKTRGFELAGPADIDVALQGTLNALSGTAAVNSADFSLAVPGKLDIRNETLRANFHFFRNPRQIKLTQGRLAIGPQSVPFSGSLASGATFLNADFKPLKIAYWKKVSPALAKLPPIAGPALSASYAGGRKGPPLIAGHFTADEITLDEQKLTRAAADFRSSGGTITITSIRGQTLGGQVKGNVTVRPRRDTYAYDFDVALQQVRLEQIPSLKKGLTGTGDLTLKASATGLAEAWRRTLSGDGTIQTQNLSIPQLDVFASLARHPAWELIQHIPGVDFDKLKSLRELDAKIRDLQSRFVIRNGLIETPGVTIDFPNASLHLKGKIGLDKSLDMQGDVALAEPLVNTFVTDARLRQFLLDKDKKLHIPLTLTGKLTAPVVAPDGSFLTARLKTAVLNYAQSTAGQKAAEEIKKKIEEKLPIPEEAKKQIPTAGAILEAIEESLGTD